MPVDHLNLTAPQIAAHVEAVLTGTPLEQAAADIRIDPADLAEAVETYRAAGQAALQPNQERAWFQARIAPRDWATAEAVFAAEIAPRLDQLHHGQVAWWYLRKHPHWRLRIRTTDHEQPEALLDGLAAAGVIDAWWPGTYEPETTAFGGPTAMTIVHDLFCADSRGVLAYARHPQPQLGRRELSLLLLSALHQHAGLDPFEAADVFARVTHLRPAPPEAASERVDALAMTMRPLLVITIDPDMPLFAASGPAAHAAAWLHGFVHAGQRLRAEDTAGRLDRGARAVIAQIVIFHWNRLGLSAQAQGILAHAAQAALLPRS